MAARKGITVCFANNKGGVGKTTTAVAVGQAWARAGKKVLYVDVDSQANMTSIVSPVAPEDREFTIRDAFLNPRNLVVEQVGENEFLIPSGLLLSNFDRDTASMIGREHLLYDLLKPLKKDYDAIVVDCPPALGLISYNAMIASDYLVMVTTPDSLAYSGMLMMTELYNDVRSSDRMNRSLELIGVVVCRYEKNRLSDMYVKKLGDELGYRFIEPVIPKATKVAQAAALRTSIYDYDPAGKATEKYLEVAQRIGVRVFSEE